ncbi:MAG TPA: hypothetical protein VNL74_14385 [Methylococcus sp.]|nr:hypothetical protein [Methylococcus sp.]
MKRTIVAALGFAALASAASPTFAFNEVFEVRMKGWEYCGNYSYRKLTKQSSKPLYAYFANDRELVISDSPDFYDWQKFTLGGESYITGKKSASFVGGKAFEDGAYFTAQIQVSFSGSFQVRKFQGNFISKGAQVVNLGPWCFSSGTIRTVKRLW